MKKIVLIIFCCLFCFNASAKRFENCIPFQGKNGKHFCYSSNVSGHWYVANSWCKAQGLKLASLNELCDYNETSRVKQDSACPNMENVTLPQDEYWTSTVRNNYISQAKTIKKQNGQFLPQQLYMKWSTAYFICKMPD